mgnify:CR=1 FL=1
MGIIESAQKAINDNVVTPVGNAAKAVVNAGDDLVVRGAGAVLKGVGAVPKDAEFFPTREGGGRSNPNVVHRAKGGPVKAGGAPMKNVDNSGMTKMKMGCK